MTEQATPEPTADPAARRERVVLVTGMSGAGHTTALKALEDADFEAVDTSGMPIEPDSIQMGPWAPSPGLR